MIEEAFKSAREELLKRIEIRDRFLGQCLISLAVLYGLGTGIEIAGNRIAAPQPGMFLFAFPTALFFLSLYQNEEILIGSQSHYLAVLSRQYNAHRAVPDQVVLWEDSPEWRNSLSSTLNLRLAAVMVGFLVIPSGLLFGFFRAAGFKWWGVPLVIAAIVGEATMFLRIAQEYRRRQRHD